MILNCSCLHKTLLTSVILKGSEFQEEENGRTIAVIICLALFYISCNPSLWVMLLIGDGLINGPNLLWPFIFVDGFCDFYHFIKHLIYDNMQF